MFRRMRRMIDGQHGADVPPGRPRFAWWVYPLVLIPLVGVMVVGAYLGSLALATKSAYDEVFVTPVRATSVAAPTATAVATVAPGQPTPTPPLAATSAPLVLPEWQGTERLNVLLLGVDWRPGDDVARSDTMILVSIDPVSKQVGMLSFPRDLWVTIPGYGQDKINAAYPLGERLKLPGGGPALAMRTVEHNFRVPVHHFATVDFNGFVKIVDTIGGVSVEVPYAIKDDAYPSDDGNNYIRLYIPAGLQHLDGATALRYARSRNFDSDFGRQRRQQQVLQAIRDQGLTLDLVPRLPGLISALAGTVKTDLDPRQLPSLVQLGRSIDREQIKSYGITPEMTVVHDTPDLYYLEPIWPKINAAVREMVGGPPLVEPTPEPVRVRAAATPTPRPARTIPTSTPRPAVAPSPTPRPAVEPTTAPARLRVWVRNATRVQGLAARNAEQLRGQGYAIVDVSQDPNTGKYPRSVVYNYGASQAQAQAVARALGLPASAVKLGPAPAPPGTDILVILGDDAAAR